MQTPNKKFRAERFGECPPIFLCEQVESYHAYVYAWHNKTTDMCYIGYKYKGDVGIFYVCSSGCPIFWADFENPDHIWERHILELCDSQDEARKMERKHFKKHNAIRNAAFYNRGSNNECVNIPYEPDTSVCIIINRDTIQERCGYDDAAYILFHRSEYYVPPEYEHIVDDIPVDVYIKLIQTTEAASFRYQELQKIKTKLIADYDANGHHVNQYDYNDTPRGMEEQQLSRLIYTAWEAVVVFEDNNDFPPTDSPAGECRGWQPSFDGSWTVVLERQQKAAYNTFIESFDSREESIRNGEIVVGDLNPHRVVGKGTGIAMEGCGAGQRYYDTQRESSINNKREDYPITPPKAVHRYTPSNDHYVKPEPHPYHTFMKNGGGNRYRGW